MSVAEQVRQYILENFLFSTDVSLLGLDESFLERGLIDSTGMLEVILFLEETFGVKVADDEMVPENLDSVNRIAAFVERKKA
ncbi:MAG TPA: acyl carrier protein [Steroidobacteraceae bacterium]|nr:acyl carrier protein [Steroidobacteraceae bacterium]HNS28594.1 acyl carrier protein [Steroidobacteraceae bacterium]